ncbi:MAG: hypothetical protein R3B09_21810 [Nannocystaceae bacterium]
MESGANEIRDPRAQGPQGPRRASRATLVAALGLGIGITATVALSRPSPAAPGRDRPVPSDLSSRTLAPKAAGEAHRPAASDPTRRPRPPIARTRAPTRGARILQAGWGTAPGELGHRRGEGSPEGPMSFIVDGEGSALVLDQVNARIQIFGPDGPVVRPLPRETFEDVAARGDGGVVLLDRLGDGVLLAMDADGRDQGATALAGDGVDDPGAVTGLFQRSDGAWVEVGHRGLVQILDADGRAPETRRKIDGRVVGEGALEAVALAARSGPTSAEIALHPPSGGPATATRELSFDLPIWQITALEGTADGRVVLGVDLVLEDDAPPHDLLEHRETAVIVGADGGELDRIDLETSEAPEESLRRLRVGADGSLYHLAFADDGATLWRYPL